MRNFVLLTVLLVWIAGAFARAETFKLANGQEVSGELLLTSANEQGIQIKIGEGNYQRVPWGNFTQDDLRTFAQNAKLQPLVEPFIEITQQERLKKTEVNIKDPPRLKRPARTSLLGGMFTSGLGLFLLVALYGATIYAGYEVALFRAQPPTLVAGLAAIPFLGVLSPIIFLALPTRLKAASADIELSAAAEAEAAALAARAAAAAESHDDNPMHVDGSQHPSSLKLAHEEKKASAALPQTVSYKRGQFTFNRRFIETKFPQFFGVVRRDSDKDMLLVISSSRGEYHGDRISRIAPNDLHLVVKHGAATEEIMIPFIEIQEIRVQHKDTIK